MIQTRPIASIPEFKPEKRMTAVLRASQSHVLTETAISVAILVRIGLVDGRIIVLVAPPSCNAVMFGYGGDILNMSEMLAVDHYEASKTT